MGNLVGAKFNKVLFLLYLLFETKKNVGGGEEPSEALGLTIQSIN